MKKSRIVILLLLVMIFSVAAVSATDVDATSDLAETQNTDDSVPLSTDSGNTNVLAGSGDKNFTTLQQEIDNSEYGMVTLDSNYVKQSGESEVIINRNIIIMGNDAYKIDANGVATISITQSLSPGKYTITCQYEQDKVSKTITIK